jgi:uncharacterized LabA/DUF88 family protein
METYSQSKSKENGESQVALFMDFENLAISAEESFGRLKTGVFIQTSEQFGRCITKRAYGDWTRFSKYGQDLLEYAIEAIQLFHYGGFNDKNAADIQMVADILEMLFTHPEIEVYILATGDSDFSAVARKLRSYGKHVIGIGLRQATSEVLVNACDQFLIYDVIVEPATRTQSYSVEQARQLLLNTMLEMTRQTGNKQILAATLKSLMLQKDHTFSEVKLGFSQFKDFLLEQKDMLEMGSRENQVVVSLNPNITEKVARDPSSEYRKALDRDGLILLDPYTRTDVLRDLFTVLKENPQHYTLLDAEAYLKAHYDSTNILRSRDEVHEAIKLIKYVDVVAPRPQSWELDTLSLIPELDQQSFIDRCESVYVAALVTRNLPINPELISKLLFGTADKQPRVTQLSNLARSKKTERAPAKKSQVLQLPARITNKPSLMLVWHDLEDFELDGEPTLERALQASEDGMRVRTSDFEQAKRYHLEAAKIIYLLLQKEAPGASLVDLEWQLSSYCATAAGAAFFRHNFPAAIEYYLAFFSIAVETEPVWEKVDRLVLPMLSFYFTIAANQEQVMLDVSPGHKHPAYIEVSILNSVNPRVQEHGKELARKLVEINPALLRKVIERLDAIISQANGQKLEEKRAQQILLEILQSSDAAAVRVG